MATASAGVYRPRHPERTVLYRVFAQHFERFVQVYEDHFAPSRGPLPVGAQEAVNRYLDCGIFACGFVPVRCGAARPELNLPDGILRNVEGQRIVADDLWRVLEPLVDGHR